MTQAAGDWIKPHLESIWAEALKKPASQHKSMGAAIFGEFDKPPKLTPKDLDKISVYGASKIAEGLNDRAAWDKHMLEGSEWIRPYLDEIWIRSNKVLEAKLANFFARKQAEQVKEAMFGEFDPPGKLTPDDIANLSAYGSAKYARGLRERAEWNAHMLEAVGDWIKPHLDTVWEATLKDFAADVAKLEKQLDALKATKDKRAVQGTDVAGMGGAISREFETNAPRRIDPAEFRKLSIYGSAKIYAGLIDRAQWNAHMIEAAGDWVKPHLDAIWRASLAEWRLG